VVIQGCSLEGLQFEDKIPFMVELSIWDPACNKINVSSSTCTRGCQHRLLVSFFFQNATFEVSEIFFLAVGGGGWFFFVSFYRGSCMLFYVFYRWWPFFIFLGVV